MFENETGICPNCGYGSSFRRRENYVVWPSIWRKPSPGRMSAFDPPIPDPPRVELTLLECLHCHDTVVLLDRTASEEEVERVVAVPEQPPRELAEAVPVSVRSFYREASVCEAAGAMRAAGVMFRAAVEQLVKAQGAEGQGLKAQIKDLRQGGLAEDVVEALHEARMLGDDSIHAGLEYSANEVADVASLIEEATHTLYVQPEERRKYREARAARRGAVGR